MIILHLSDTHGKHLELPPFGYCDEWHCQHCGDKVLREKLESLSALDAHYNIVENPFQVIEIK